MKIRKDKRKQYAALAAAIALIQMAGITASAQTCMTEDLFLYIAPKKESAKAQKARVRSGGKTTGAGIAGAEPKDSSHLLKARNDRGNDRQKIAGRS